MSRKKLAGFLKKRGINAEIVDTGEETATVAASSEVLGLSRRKIAKSIIFRSDVGVIVVIMRGDQRVSERKLAGVLGAKNIVLADRKTVKEVTGYDVGGVPPVGHDHQKDMMYVMDLKLLECDVVYAGGGDSRAQLSIRVKDVTQLVNPKIADIAE
ncbi:MAG: YbaK/EbsC family protein [Thermoproteota archaeon]|nr:YbaK/EbsC family protein [Thermoproteota archaeon]